MKKTISIILTVCLMLGLFSTYAFADTPLDVWTVVNVNAEEHVDIFSDYVSSNDSYSHTGKIIIAGMSNWYIHMYESGEYEIDFHSFTMSPTRLYNGLNIVEPNTTVYASFHGINVFENGVSPFYVTGSSTLIIDVADNSSLTLKPGSNGLDNSGEGTIKLADGNPLPAPDADGNIVITKGTPTACTHTYDQGDSDYCILKCNGTAITKSLHAPVYTVVEGGHIESCVNCGKQLTTTATQHTPYYYADGDKCVEYCEFCDYVGAPTEHTMTEYALFNDEYCINICEKCGYGDEDKLVKHDIQKTTLEATDAVARCELEECQRCTYSAENFDKKDNIFFELTSEYNESWNDSFIIVVKDGTPLTKVSYVGVDDVCEYAIPYDKNSSYMFLWVGRNEFDDEFGAKIYLPDKDEPIFESEDMSGYYDFESLVNVNTITAADIMPHLSVVASIPSSFEYYTKASVDSFVEAYKTFNEYIYSADVNGLSVASAALKAAVDGLVPTEEPTTFGVINMRAGDLFINDGELGYDIDGDFYPYSGKYFIFDSTGSTTNYINVADNSADITICNLVMNGYEGALCSYTGDIKLTALGFCAFIPEEESTYAGIEIGEDASLTITKESESIFAMGDDNCAGIGGYYYSEESSKTGKITIDGGNIFAFSTDDGAGIGGAYGEGFDSITINGGKIYAECLANDGAAIGAGDDGIGGDIIINGGDITALSLDDDGAGIGAGDSGYIDSITITGGKIVVGSDDAAAIGGGSSSVSFGGKITINGGLIIEHHRDSSSAFIGNDSDNEAPESETNFVQINGGNFVSDGKIFPEPKNKAGQLLVKKEFNVDSSFADKEITIELSDGTKYLAMSYGTKLTVFVPKDSTIDNMTYLKTGKKVEDATKVFKDVKAGKWYVQAINYNYSYGFIAGMKADEFGVSTPVTRGMFITVLARIAGVDTSNNNVTTKFTDVAKGKYYTAAIKWASENGVVNGMSATTFEPNSALLRQQLCVMIVNFAKYSKVELNALESAISFADASSFANWAKDAIAVCQKADIVNGYNEGSKVIFKPTATATRAEAAQILYKFHSDFVVQQ